MLSISSFRFEQEQLYGLDIISIAVLVSGEKILLVQFVWTMDLVEFC